MLRIIQSGNALPLSYPVDPNAVFQPSMIGQLGILGNNIVCGVSDGTAPLGLIDDIKTTAFTAPSIDEEIIVSAVGISQGGVIVSAMDVKAVLQNPNIIPSSFTTSPVDVELIPRNGVIIFPAGTPLNFDMDGDGIPDAIRTVVSYTYQVPNIPGDDSTQASGKVTIWFTRIIFQSDMFETNQRYPINANLFCSESGLLTTRQPSADHPGIAFVTGGPTSVFSTLEAMWI